MHQILAVPEYNGMLISKLSASPVEHVVMSFLDYFFSIHELLVSRHLGNALKYFAQ